MLRSLGASRFSIWPVLSSNITTLAASSCEIVAKMAKVEPSIKYRPDLLSLSEESLRAAICETRPDVLICGPNKIDADTLELWRQAMPQGQLTIIRRGTGLDEIDCEAASNHNITVKNTPYVNAAEVAKASYRFIESKGALGIIGFGYIGQAIAKMALEQGKEVIVYSPSMSLSHSKYHPAEVKVARQVSDVFAQAQDVIVAASYKAGTKLITAEDVQEISAAATLVSVSPTGIFTDEALQALAASTHKGTKLVFDNSKSSMAALKIKMEKFGVDASRATFQSLVMSSQICQRDMDIAVAARLLETTLETKWQEISESVKKCALEIEGKKATVIGRGIGGVMAALFLQEHGFEVELLEKDAKGKQTGITAGAYSVRHLSLSETTTHAMLSRLKDWAFDKIQDPDFYEALFTKQFTSLAQNPPLVMVLKRAVARINDISIRGAEGWQELREKYPDIFGDNIFGEGRMARIFFRQQDLEKALAFHQSLCGKEARQISKEELLTKYPQLEPFIASKDCFGAIETPGYSVAIIDLLDSIGEAKMAGTLRYETAASWRDGQIFAVHKDEERLLDSPIVVASGVNPVLPAEGAINRTYGLFIKIPNLCGLKMAFKAHETDPLDVMNITPSKDGKFIIISGGLEYFGHRFASEEELKPLFKLLEEKAAQMFPLDYAQAVAKGNVEKKFCPRPMTSHGFPSFISQEGITSIGGANSGGTVQSPFLAQLARLQVEYDYGLFAKNPQLNEEVRSFLGVIKEALGSIKEALGEPSKSTSGARAEGVVIAKRAL